MPFFHYAHFRFTGVFTKRFLASKHNRDLLLLILLRFTIFFCFWCFKFAMTFFTYCLHIIFFIYLTPISRVPVPIARPSQEPATVWVLRLPGSSSLIWVCSNVREYSSLTHSSALVYRQSDPSITTACITFGMPRTGNRAWAQAFNQAVGSNFRFFLSFCVPRCAGRRDHLFWR